MRLIDRAGRIGFVKPEWKVVRHGWGGYDKTVYSTNSGKLWQSGPDFNLKKAEFSHEPRRFNEDFAAPLEEARAKVDRLYKEYRLAQREYTELQVAAHDASAPLTTEQLKELVVSSEAPE